MARARDGSNPSRRPQLQLTASMTMTATKRNLDVAPLYQRIIETGDYKVETSCSIKKEVVSYIENELFDLIETTSGKDIADNVRKNGLSSMHKFVSPDSVIELQDKLSERIKLRMLNYTAHVASESLGLGKDFYLDLMVISRIKFPFEVSRKSTMSYMDYSKWRGRTTFAKPPEMTSGYHKNLPFPAWAHGTHADSWFGHSFDGINLWWAIDGVTKESGMTFYPDYIGDNTYPLHEEPPYLSKEFALPKPVFFDLNPGDIILFNSDNLHGTRVNVSDVTRVSLSTRLNPNRPRFNPDQFRHVKLWIHSSNLDAFTKSSGKIPTIEESHRLGGEDQDNKLIFTAPKEDVGINGVFGNSCKKSARIPITVIEVSGSGKVRIGNSNDFKLGQKTLIKVSDKEVVVARTTTGLHAISAKCPHVGYNLAYGGHDDESIYCPGHGLSFHWETGEGCGRFRVKKYNVYEIKNNIYIET